MGLEDSPQSSVAMHKSSAWQYSTGEIPLATPCPLMFGPFDGQATDSDSGARAELISPVVRVENGSGAYASDRVFHNTTYRPAGFDCSTAYFPFEKLPMELQDAIWLLALPPYQIFRVVHMNRPGLCISSPPLPAAFSICKRSRIAATSRFDSIPLTDREGDDRRLWCDLRTDILWIDDILRTEHDDPSKIWCSARTQHSHFSGPSHPWSEFRTIAFYQYFGVTPGWEMAMFSKLNHCLIAVTQYPPSAQKHAELIPNHHLFACSPKLQLIGQKHHGLLPIIQRKSSSSSDDSYPQKSHARSDEEDIKRILRVAETERTTPTVEEILVKMHCECQNSTVLKFDGACHPLLWPSFATREGG